MDVALPFISLATAQIPLPPLGTLGLDPTRMLALPTFVIPQPAGVGSVSVAGPNNPGLVGASIYAQALLLPYPFQARLTNVTADVVIQERSLGSEDTEAQRHPSGAGAPHVLGHLPEVAR